MSHLDDDALLQAVDAGAKLRDLAAAGYGSRSGLSRRVQRLRREQAEAAETARRDRYNASRPTRTSRPAIQAIPDPDAANPLRRPELADHEPPPTRSTQDGAPANLAADPFSAFDLQGRTGEQPILQAGTALGKPVTFVNAAAILESGKVAQRLGVRPSLILLFNDYLLRDASHPLQPYRRIYAGAHCAALLGDDWTGYALHRALHRMDYDQRYPNQPRGYQVHEAEIDITVKGAFQRAITETARKVFEEPTQRKRSGGFGSPNAALLEMAVRQEPAP